MSNKVKKSALLAKYMDMYKKKPRSRVFAPLAESYRTLGMYEEAFKTLKEGMRYHPGYTLAHIVLAQCYFDKQNYELAYSTLMPLAAANLDNIRLQKLFAQICINLGYLEEALQTFKYLLLINPKDEYIAEQVKLLEDDLLIAEGEEYVINPQDNNFDLEDEWLQVDFNKKENTQKSSNDELTQWEVKKDITDPLAKYKSEINSDKISVKEHDLNDDFYRQDFDNEDEKEEEVEAQPIITHTLVDLYLRQGHKDKAMEILESILELHPDDKATKQRLGELRGNLSKDDRPLVHKQVETKISETEPENHERLLNLVENKKQQALKKYSNSLTLFLEKIKRTSKQKLEYL